MQFEQLQLLVYVAVIAIILWAVKSLIKRGNTLWPYSGITVLTRSVDVLAVSVAEGDLEAAAQLNEEVRDLGLPTTRVGSDEFVLRIPAFSRQAAQVGAQHWSSRFVGYLCLNRDNGRLQLTVKYATDFLIMIALSLSLLAFLGVSKGVYGLVPLAAVVWLIAEFILFHLFVKETVDEYWFLVTTRLEAD